MLPSPVRAALFVLALSAGCAFEIDPIEIEAGVADLSTRDLTPVDFSVNPDAWDGGAPRCPGGQVAQHAGDLVEGDLSRWGAAPVPPFSIPMPTATATADVGRVAEGAVSVRLDSTHDQAVLFYPQGRNAGWDLTSVRTLTIRVASATSGWRGVQPHLLLLTDSSDYFELVPDVTRLPTAPEEGFVTLEIPLAGGAGWARNEFGIPSLFTINYLGVTFGAAQTGLTVWLDGVRFGPGTFLDCSP